MRCSGASGFHEDLMGDVAVQKYPVLAMSPKCRFQGCRAWMSRVQTSLAGKIYKNQFY